MKDKEYNDWHGVTNYQGEIKIKYDNYFKENAKTYDITFPNEFYYSSDTEKNGLLINLIYDKLSQNLPKPQVPTPSSVDTVRTMIFNDTAKDLCDSELISRQHINGRDFEIYSYEEIKTALINYCIQNGVGAEIDSIISSELMKCYGSKYQQSPEMYDTIKKWAGWAGYTSRKEIVELKKRCLNEKEFKHKKQKIIIKNIAIMHECIKENKKNTNTESYTEKMIQNLENIAENTKKSR